MNEPFKGLEVEFWSVDKEIIYSAKVAVESGLEYAKECLARHDSELGRNTRKNKFWAQTMENDIRQMEATLNKLKLLK